MTFTNTKPKFVIPVLVSILLGVMFSSAVGSAYACVSPPPSATPPVVIDIGSGEFVVIQAAQTFGGFTGDVCGAGLTFGSIITAVSNCVVFFTGTLNEVPGFENFIQNITLTSTLETQVPVSGLSWQGFTNIVSTNVAAGQDVVLNFTISAPGASVEDVQAALSGGAIATGKTNSDGSDFIDHFTITPVDNPIKVDICHKGKKTISVSSNAIPAHIAHGDTIGPCE